MYDVLRTRVAEEEHAMNRVCFCNVMQNAKGAAT